MLGSQVVPLPGENELNIPSTKLWGNLLMLFPGNFPCWVLYLKLWFSQFFKSYFCFSSGSHCFSFFLWWSLLFIFIFNTPHLVLYISLTLFHSVPLNELFHLPHLCSGELLPMLQDSLMNPYPNRSPLPGRAIHSLLFLPTASLLSHQTLHTYSLKECFVSFISVTLVVNILSGTE